jgi:nicotinate-nucleotide pyrophosphorylase (carboxylating)
MSLEGTARTGPTDIRAAIFSSIAKLMVTARIIADDQGIVAGTEAARLEADAIGLRMIKLLAEGEQVKPGEEIALFQGKPEQIAAAEERLIGIMAKPSGIATAARKYVERAGSRPEIVAGAWKKIPSSQKEASRKAITTGGARCRISESPFLYLDKNYIRMFGGIRQCLTALNTLNGYLIVVQISGEHGAIESEAGEAVESGANIVFIDSGRTEDIERVNSAIDSLGLRREIKLAFGGNVHLEDLDLLKTLHVDIVDVGRGIIDAPLLDMHLEVISSMECPAEVQP